MVFQDFTEVRESQGQKDYSLPPIGEYPCVMLVEAFQKDSAGNYMKGANNKPAPIKTTAGDDMWKLNLKILDTKHLGKQILDNVSFGEKAKKRTAVIFTRAGIMPSDKECEANPKLYAERNRDFQPDELDETYWFVSMHHELAENKDGVRVGKYDFKANGCPCEVCTSANGKKVMVNAKVDYAGYRLADLKTEAPKLRKAWLAMEAAEEQKASPAGDDDDIPSPTDDNSDIPF